MAVKRPEQYSTIASSSFSHRHGPRGCVTDLPTGEAAKHRTGAGSPGEALFVPSGSGPADESYGWYLGYAYDPIRNGSDLVIVDTSDFTGTPMATIKLPTRVPP